MNKILSFVLIFLSLTLLVGCTTVDESDVSIYLNEGIDTIEINSEFVDMGATSKAFGLSIQNEVIYNDVDTTKLGTYKITYQVDYKNVIKNISRIVTVIDETPPTATLNPGIDTIKKGAEWTDASVTVLDNSGEEIEVLVVGTVNTNIKGEYFITYILEDSSGNQSNIIRYVNVIE